MIQYDHMIGVGPFVITGMQNHLQTKWEGDIIPQ